MTTQGTWTRLETAMPFYNITVNKITQDDLMTLSHIMTG